MDTIPTMRLDGCSDGAQADHLKVDTFGDYGCDHAELCDEHIQLFAAANLLVPILTLQGIITTNLAVEVSDDDLTVTEKRKSRVFTSLMALRGPLHLQNVDCLVLEEPMPEVLLS